MSCVLCDPHGVVRAGPDGETVRFPSDPLEDEEILAGMDHVYYEQSFDASDYELKVQLFPVDRVWPEVQRSVALQKLPSVLDLHVINGDRQRLLRQMTVVTKRVFAQILERRVNCADEMQRVGDITQSIDDSLLECRAARRLAHAESNRGNTALSKWLLCEACIYRRFLSAPHHNIFAIPTIPNKDSRIC
jgi:hypothetical protein